MRHAAPDFLRKFAVQIAFLATVALGIFWGLYALDHRLTGGVSEGPHASMFARYLSFDPGSITDAVSALAGVVAAVLGIVITVVSIIVQLSADRYTGVTALFLRDRVNVGVLAFYVIACVAGVWLSVSLHHDYVPRAVLVAMLAMTSLGLVLMGPYFGYVFWFLEPGNIIARIRREAVEHARSGALEQRQEALFEAQAETLASMEELTDITSNSISGKDKIIASEAVDALKDLALEYLRVKSSASPAWFSIGPGIRGNPDFVAMDPESLSELAARRTWVEWKVMRQYLGIYNESLAAMRDINYLIAIDTRYIGEEAARLGDRELVALVFRFMNSYLRSTLNARDVRTAYNVLNQYRLLVEAMLRSGRGPAALEGVKFMKYYGHVSFDMKLTFVTETVAYDVSTLCEIANHLGAGEERAMLAEFLELDQPLLARSQEKGLLGVRKAQVKLACYYLHSGQEELARTICRDMEDEPPERLQAIRQQLEGVTSKDFWEIIDRGRNFEFMAPEQRATMATFFGWLGIPDAGSAAPAAPEA
ncbi:MAG: DUF2254 domain-containing protein, partial [Deltaproteobacteria bacterium]|nr:DUF2254 domain-containing protein [Deltaproteobacteria bacterium]